MRSQEFYLYLKKNNLELQVSNIKHQSSLKLQTQIGV